VVLDYRRYHNPSTLIKRPSFFMVAIRVGQFKEIVAL